MSGWEYKVVPAPTKGLKAPGLKGPQERFANAVETLMNQMGADGWEFQRSETLPSTERSGLTSTTTEWRNMMVFRRPLVTAMDAFEPELLAAPAPQATQFAAKDTAPVATHPNNIDVDATLVRAAAPFEAAQDADESAAFKPGSGATQMLPDNGVEETSEVSGMTASLRNLVTQRKLKDSRR
jgi:hypothetical protein